MLCDHIEEYIEHSEANIQRTQTVKSNVSYTLIPTEIIFGF